MLNWLGIIGRTLWLALRTHRALAVENLTLRQQLAVLKHRQGRARLSDADRLFWVPLSRIWTGRREFLHIVWPDTVVRWHRQGFRYYWRLKSRCRVRPRIDPGTRDLIRRMCRANPLWGAPRIHGDLLKHGIDVSEAKVSKYIIRSRRPPSQTWRTFLENHAKELVALDLFTVPTAPRSPWQNPYAERVVGSIRRECLDHMIILGERNLKRVLSSYVDYYDSARTYLSLEKDAPDGRVVQPIENGRVVELKRVGGLHHLYARMAA